MTKRIIGLGLLLTLVGLIVSCSGLSKYEGLDGTTESQFTLTLEGFRFSKRLANSKSNFRFIVGLRYFDQDGNFNTVHTIMPGLDSFWECDPGRRRKPNYVRGLVKDGYVNFDMKAVGEWDRLIFLVKGVRLHSIQFRVFDVNREDVGERLSGLIKGVFAMGAGVATGNIPSTLAAPVRGLTNDLRVAAMNEITSEDDLLFRELFLFYEEIYVADKQEIHVISSDETKHNYEIIFKVKRKGVLGNS